MATLVRRVRRPANPKADPRFQRVEGKLRADANRVKQHPPARKKAAEAQAAAKGPANEKLAGAKANQVDKMQEAPTGKPDENSFLNLLRSEIEKVLPKNNSEAKDFVDEGQKAQVKENVGGNVKEQKDAAASGVQGASTEPPNPSGVPAKPVTPIPGEPAPPTPQVDAPGAMPAPKPDADISLQQSKDAANQEMAENQITKPQCQKANDPRFSSVLTAKDNLDKQADAAPKQYRTQERAALTQTAAKATAEARVGAAQLTATRNRSGAQVSARQSAAKLKDEQRRQEFTNKIEAIYTTTKQVVELKLNSLETEVMADFDVGIDRGLNNMKTSAQREIDDFYDDRYSGAFGWTDWIADKFKDTPQKVKDIIKEARARFTTEMDRLVVRIAATVERKLKEAKDVIAKGQSLVKAEVDKLPANLKAFGQQAEQEMGSRFDEMRQGVEDRKNALATKLAEKYKEASEKADAAAKKMEEENQGLFKKLADFIGEIIKIIREFKNKLMALLRKAADLIMDILSDPIGFLGNLLGAIKQGVGQFVKNIWDHLKRGFMEWLFGNLASAGIEIPSDLSLPSILKLVLGILGLTYDRLRAKAVKLIGERNVKILEKLYEYVKTLITEGPAALWAKVKDDLSNLKEMVIDAIQSWLIETVVKQAVLKLLSFFNPAGAFVQACIAIYNTVMFLIERASQIMSFIEAVINSVSAIVAGNIGQAANWIEQSLAKMIPLVISFLARLIGLGGISQKIKEIIQKVQGFVDKAIDKVLAKIVAVVKKLFGKGGKDGKEGDAGLPPETQRKLDAGLAAIESTESAAKREGKLDEEGAQQVAATVKGAHPVFRSLTAVERGGIWVYDYVVNPRGSKSGAKTTTKTYLGARKVKGKYTGSFSDPAWTWTGYPTKATRHPANDAVGSPNGPVPKPTGDYTVPSGKTPGNISTAMWRGIIYDKKEAYKDKLFKANPGTRRSAWETPAKNAVEDEYRSLGYRLPYQDLYLVEWDQHHIHPASWKGAHNVANMQFIRRYKEHSPITGWWNSRQADLKKNLK